MASRAQKRSEALKSEDINELLDELVKRIDRLKVLYEQYFLGIQRTPPNQLHRELERRIRELTQANIRNTGVRFRFTTLSQKFAAYNTYWSRTLKQMEAGTYVRDVARVGREALRSGKEVPEELLAKMPKAMRERILRDQEKMNDRARVLEEREQGLRESGKVRENKPGNVHQLDASDLLDDFDLDSIFSSMVADEPKASGMPEGEGDFHMGGFGEDTIEDAPRRPAPATAPATATVAAPAPARAPAPRSPVPRPAAPAPPVPSAVKPPPGMSEAEGQALYKRYKKARELVGENTSGLSYDKLMTSLNKQTPKILEQHQAKGVSFDVVVKGDRVVLKAKPQKG